MKLSFVFLALMALASEASAGDFDARAKAGKAAEKRAEGARYLSVLGSAYGQAMRNCIVLGSSDSKNLGRFELVADISPDGRVMDAETRPRSAVSLCFAREFTKLTLTPPPGTGSSPYPVHVAMEIAP